MLSFLLAVWAPPARAVDLNYVVTTTGDTIDADDGLTSFREAVIAINTANPATARVELAASVDYTLTLCGNTGQPFAGPITVSGATDLTIDGNDARILTSCPADRLLEGTASLRSLVVEHLTLEGGTNGAIASARNLTLDGVAVTNTTGDPQAEAAVKFDGSEFTMHETTIRDSVELTALAINSDDARATITDSSISDNVRTAGQDCSSGVFARGDVTIVDSLIVRNRATTQLHPPPTWANQQPPELNSALDGCGTGGVRSTGRLSLTRVEVANNQGTEVGGIYGVDTNVNDSNLHDNYGAHGGASTGGTVTGTRIHHNHGLLTGGIALSGSMRNSTVDNNVGGQTGGLALLAGGTPLAVTNSTVTENRGGAFPGVLIDEKSATSGPMFPPVDVILTSTSIARNHRSSNPAPGSATDFTIRTSPRVRTVASANAFGANPNPTVPPCSHRTAAGGLTESTMLSRGNNFATNQSCFTQVQPTDRVGGDPRFAALTLNGDEVPTIAPLAGSTLLDQILATTPTCRGSDQRGQSRPQGTGCDIGAVEVAYGGYHPVAPARVLDTRTGGDSHRIGPGETRTIGLTGIGGIPSTGVAAVTVNTTVADATVASHLTLWPQGTVTPETSTLNWSANQVVANLSTIMIDPELGTLRPKQQRIRACDSGRERLVRHRHIDGRGPHSPTLPMWRRLPPRCTDPSVRHA